MNHHFVRTTYSNRLCTGWQNAAFARVQQLFLYTTTSPYTSNTCHLPMYQLCSMTALLCNSCTRSCVALRIDYCTDDLAPLYCILLHSLLLYISYHTSLVHHLCMFTGTLELDCLLCITICDQDLDVQPRPCSDSQHQRTHLLPQS